jgi:beta-N-acetylhexosaminidase
MHLRELRRHVGRLALVGFTGPSVPGDLRRLVSEFDSGGLILAAGNIVDPCQAADLSRELRGLRREWPLWIGLGALTVLPPPFTEWPPACTLGRADEPALVSRFASALGRELMVAGVDFVCWPDLGVGTAPVMLAADPETVARAGSVVVGSLQASGIVSCCRSFPGNGRAVSQGAHAPDVLDVSPEDLDSFEFVPYRAAIEEEVAAIAMANILVPSLDERRAAPISHAIVETRLKRTLGFRGVVVADAVAVNAADVGNGASGLPVTSVELVDAGCDALLLSGCTIDDQAAVFEALIRAGESGALTSARIDDAWARQRRVKELFGARARAESAGVVGSTAHQQIAAEMRGWL